MKEKTSHIDCLTRWFGETFDEGGDNSNGTDITSKSLRLDILLHCVRFVDKHGLMEKEMKLFVIFFNKLFEDMICDDLHIEEAALFLKKRLSTFFKTHPKYTNLFAKSAIDYITSTFIQHYELLFFVMNNERDEDLTVNEQEVCIPLLPEALSSATIESVWELETKMNEEEETYEQKKKEISSQYDKMQKKLAEEIVSYMKSTDEINLNSANIISITSTILQKYTDLTLAELNSVLDSSKNYLTHNIEKVKIVNENGAKKKSGR